MVLLIGYFWFDDNEEEEDVEELGLDIFFNNFVVGGEFLI